MQKPYLFGILATLIFTLGTTATHAAVFQYDGTVELCPVTGIPPCDIILFVGDTIAGPINVADIAVAPNSSFSYTDVESFNIAVGDFFAVTSDNSMLVAGDVTTDAAGEISGGYLAILASAIDAPDTLVTLDLTTSTWMAQALIPGVPVPVFLASGYGSFTVVPVPAGIFLLLPALGVLGSLRRRA